MNLEFDFAFAYHLLYQIALVWFGVLITFMLIRSVIGPRITDRILSINMIGTMVICCLCILSVLMAEAYLVDVALLYAMISFVSVLIFATIYIPAKPSRGKFTKDVRSELVEEHRYMAQMRRMLSETEKREENREGTPAKERAFSGSAVHSTAGTAEPEPVRMNKGDKGDKGDKGGEVL